MRCAALCCAVLCFACCVASPAAPCAVGCPCRHSQLVPTPHSRPGSLAAYYCQASRSARPSRLLPACLPAVRKAVAAGLFINAAKLTDELQVKLSGGWPCEPGCSFVCCVWRHTGWSLPSGVFHPPRCADWRCNCQLEHALLPTLHATQTKKTAGHPSTASCARPAARQRQPSCAYTTAACCSAAAPSGSASTRQSRTTRAGEVLAVGKLKTAVHCALHAACGSACGGGGLYSLGIGCVHEYVRCATKCCCATHSQCSPSHLPFPLAGTKCGTSWPSSRAGSPSWRHTCTAWRLSTHRCGARCSITTCACQHAASAALRRQHAHRLRPSTHRCGAEAANAWLATPQQPGTR